MKTNIKIPKDIIADFCKRNHIRRLAFFGSVQRNDFKPESDVDVLVEFEPGRTPGFFKLFDMEEEFSALIGGNKVDLRTPDELSRYFRGKITTGAETYYVQG